jgi:hypothetical protein
MKLLARDEQCVSDLPADDQEDDFQALDIIQDAKVADPQLQPSTTG